MSINKYWLVICLSILAGGCSKSEKIEQPEFDESVEQEIIEPIKIGDLWSYTGFANYGKTYKQGWQLALKEVNEAGGVLGRPVEVISRDAQRDPGQAVTAANDLIHSEGVFALMGVAFSHIGLAVSQAAEREQVPFVAAWCGTDKLLWDNGHRYVFRISPGNIAYSGIAAAAVKHLPAKRWGILASNYEAGHAYVGNFKPALLNQRPDVEFVVEQWPTLGKLDAGITIQALRSDNPEALLVFLPGADNATFIREKQTRDWTGVDVFSFMDGFPEEMIVLESIYPDGHHTFTLPSRDSGGAAYKKFYDGYQVMHNESAGFASALGYLALRSIVEGIREAGEIDREKFIDAMERIEFDFFADTFSFEPNYHQGLFDLETGVTKLTDDGPQIVDRQYHFAKDHLAPEEVVAARRAQ
ncbi:MAG: ABC transporter substrate-binding protein [Gammaproteobacteria bacterium]|nr:ABC transporter substrate-binding protein [Gammaproteobacteria bacterium]